MRDCTTSGAVVAVLSLLCVVASPAAETGWFVVNGFFEDWEVVPVAHLDDIGDGDASGVDFGALRVASDAHRIHLDFEIGAERLLQQVDEIVLFIDADNSASTGRPVGGIGAELEWRFGDKHGTAYGAGETEHLYHEDIGLRVGPSYSSTRFEICVSRDVEFWGSPLMPGDSVTILLRDESEPEGDWLPDEGSTLTDVVPYQTAGHDAYTWRNYSDPYCPSRIDYVVYSDSVLELASHFIAQSPLRWDTGYEPRHEQWSFWPFKIYWWVPQLEYPWYVLIGFKRYEATLPHDTEVASNHLPVVADFRLIGSP